MSTSCDELNETAQLRREHRALVEAAYAILDNLDRAGEAGMPIPREVWSAALRLRNALKVDPLIPDP